MTREIKFRAWNPNSKRMYIIDVLALWEVTWSCSSENWMSIAYQPHIEVMQFTWLLDKNGKEIYEGDIVSVEFSNWNIDKWIIEYESWTYWINYFTNSSEELRLEYEYSQIIWNIYENPELLTK